MEAATMYLKVRKAEGWSSRWSDRGTTLEMFRTDISGTRGFESVRAALRLCSVQPIATAPLQFLICYLKRKRGELGCELVN